MSNQESVYLDNDLSQAIDFINNDDLQGLEQFIDEASGKYTDGGRELKKLIKAAKDLSNGFRTGRIKLPSGSVIQRF